MSLIWLHINFQFNTGHIWSLIRYIRVEKEPKRHVKVENYSSGKLSHRTKLMFGSFQRAVMQTTNHKFKDFRVKILFLFGPLLITFFLSKFGYKSYFLFDVEFLINFFVVNFQMTPHSRSARPFAGAGHATSIAISSIFSIIEIIAEFLNLK